MRPRPLVLLALFIIPPTAATAGNWRRGDDFNVTTRREVKSCADIEVSAPGRALARGEERVSLPLSGGPLRVRAAGNTATVVTGSAGAAFDVLLCRAAAADSPERAEARLAAIALRSDGRELSTSGPAAHDDDHHDWMAYLLIRAPRGADLDLEIRNGPLSLERTEGRFAIRGSNGPVSLDDVTGEVTVDLENGPLSLHGGGGSMRLRTKNGPISVHLSGADWDGEGLDARAVNGPLDVNLDPDYGGSVLVESSDHAPWSCGAACRSATRTWDEGQRRVEFGSAPFRVRLATVNGPVQIDRDGD